MDSKSKITAVFSVPFVSSMKSELFPSPAPLTRLYVIVAPASGSVALNSPTKVPVTWFSGTVRVPEIKLAGVVLLTAFPIIKAFCIALWAVQ